MANVHPIKVTACLNPECQAKPPLAARGLCLPCYNQARAAIRRCATTWAKLEELGVARPRNFPLLRCSADWLSSKPAAIRAGRLRRAAAKDDYADCRQAHAKVIGEDCSERGP